MKTGIQAIIHKINVDAEEHSNDHRGQMKEEIDEEINHDTAVYLGDLSKRSEMLKKHNEIQYMRLHERLSSRLNREILTYQRNLINEIFDKAISKLREASDKEFTDMFNSAVANLKGKYTLYLGELSKGKLDDAAIAVAIENAGADITLSGETIPKKSGFVLKDDRVEYNCLFEDLIEDKKNEQAALVLKEVFGETGNKLIQ
ncbi:MAG: hypothetical protein FWF15_06435 [Oscillospiraceae bacterium]|nr:hypothetical protein [Oscillospiraceae bacterium]